MLLFRKKIHLLILIALIAVLPLLGFGCKPRFKSRDVLNKIDSVTLNYWQIESDAVDMKPLIDVYRRTHPHINIQFRKLLPEEYEQEMIKALADEQGPDIFSIPATWVREYQKKIMPMPVSVKTTSLIIRASQQPGGEDEILKVLTQEKLTMTPRQIKENYLRFVRDDAISVQTDENGEAVEVIMGLPLSADVLSLYYNKQLLERVDIFDAPITWSQFQNMVIKLTQYDRERRIIQSGAALGVSENIPRAVDILSVLMMQIGVPITNETSTYAMFHEETESGFSGIDALRFYTDFANPVKEVYSWNEEMPNAIEAFKQQKTAFFIGYAYHLPIIERGASRLTLGVAPLPQPEGSTQKINIARFWLETVSGKTQHPDEAWDFLLFLSEPQNTKELLARNGRLPVHKALLSEMPKSANLAVFQNQLLDAETWYHGKDAGTAEEALKEMIASVVKGESSLEQAVNYGAAKVTETLR